MSVHPVWLLAFVTFGIVLAVAVWSLISTRRRQKYGPNVEGLGGEKDPLA